MQTPHNLNRIHGESKEVYILGYLRFGRATLASFLSNSTFESLKWPYAIAQLLIAVVLILSFPLLADPFRASIEQIIKLSNPKAPAQSSTRLTIITVVLVASCAFMAIKFGDDGLNYLGIFTALSGSLLVFIFPSLYFLTLIPTQKISIVERSFAYFNIVFGVFLLILGTYYKVLKVLK